MDLVTILRDLWRLRRFVAVVLVLAVVAAAGIKFTSPSYSTGIASVQILVDTPSSQVVAVSPKGSDSTAARADLLASLMVDGQVKADIAQRAGVPHGRLFGITTAATDPTGTAVTPPSDPQAYVLNTQVLTNSSGDELPIIEVDTRAPTREGAAKVASAAISGLGAYLNSKAALEKISDADRLQVSGIGLPQSTVQTKGTSAVLVVLVFVFMFLGGCGAILGIRAIVRGWRAASLREQMGDQVLPDWHVDPDPVGEVDDYGSDRMPGRLVGRDASGLERAAAHDEEGAQQIVGPPPQDWLARGPEDDSGDPDVHPSHERLPRMVRRWSFPDDRAADQEVA